MRNNKDEEGQAIVLVALAMGIFLIGAVGLAVDGAHIYAQRQMAQAAADAAAQAGIMSIFDKTTGASGTGFSTSSAFTCSTSDTRTPCAYASKDGFGGTASDTVTVDFPTSASYPGVAVATDYPNPLLRVNVQRNVSTTLMRFLGSTVTTVLATATAAIVNVISPVPILVTHPTLSSALATNGGVLVTICGGPGRSIQVNSSSTTAVTTAGGGTVDLSKAGPPDTGNCLTGTGSDFGVWGGPSSPSFTFLGGTTGKYRQPASAVPDPLAGVSAPAVPTNSGSMGTSTALAPGVSGCPALPVKPCKLYNPGLWAGGIDGKLTTPVFKPGIYYIQGGGFKCNANCNMYMATGFTDTGAGTTNTGWDGTASGGGILVYNTGSVANPTATGPINIGSNGSITLVGSPTGSAYKGILFFQDRSADAQTHSLGGGGGLNLTGTVYLTNTLATMQASSSHYQALSLQGTPGSSTLIQGEIIVGTLNMGGNAGITMNLDPSAAYVIDQVALVN